jgi:hypothetical protein
MAAEPEGATLFIQKPQLDMIHPSPILTASVSKFDSMHAVLKNTIPVTKKMKFVMWCPVTLQS